MKESDKKKSQNHVHHTNHIIQDLERKSPWSYWTLFYLLFVIGAMVITVAYIGLGFPLLGFDSTDVNSARYLLSSIIQGQAAIIAIVISLTLVAMQLIASSYSPRVARIFSSGRHMYVILGFYILSITYSAIVLQLITGEKGSIVPVLDYLVSFSLWFAVFLMIALIPYISNILKLLQPEMIVSRECERISKDTILTAASQSNPLDLIFDILHQAVMKYDTGLLKGQLPKVTGAVITTLSDSPSDDEIIMITQDYSQRLTVCAQQSIQLEDLGSTRIILENLKDLANCTIALQKDNASRQVIDSIQLLENIAGNKRSWNNLTQIIEVLEDCGKNAIDKNLVSTTAGICICLKQVTQDSINLVNPDQDFGPFHSLAEKSIDIVSAFAHSAISSNRKDLWDTILMYLQDIAKYIRNKKNIQLTPSVAEKILDLWLVAVQNKMEITSFSVMSYEAYHSRNLLVEKYRYSPYIYEYKIMEVGIVSFLNNLKYSMDSAARLLADFRVLDVINYNQNLNRYYEDLKDEKEKAAYLQVFELSVDYAKQKEKSSK